MLSNSYLIINEFRFALVIHSVKQCEAWKACYGRSPFGQYTFIHWCLLPRTWYLGEFLSHECLCLLLFLHSWSEIDCSAQMQPQMFEPHFQYPN